MGARTLTANISLKILSLLMVLAVVVTVVPTTSYAFGIATVEVPGSPLNISSGATAVATGATAVATGAQTSKDLFGDPLAYAVSRVVISTLTRSTVNWINSGFSGSPAFVQDLQSEFLIIGDTVATRYIDEFLQNDSIRDNPFRDEIGQAVLSGYFSATGRDGFYLKNPYNLGEYSSDPRAFVNGDYRQGGLAAWRELVFNPGNNPLLLRQSVSETLYNKIGSAVDTRKTELSYSNGFNSFRGKCTKVSPTFSGGTNVNTGGVLSFDGTSSSGGSASVNLTNTDTCLGSPILTPGALISQSANKYLVDNGLDQLIQADEVNEIVNALVGQLVNQVLGSGGLAGTTRPSGAGRSYIDRLGDPKQSASDSASLDLSNTFLTTIAKQALALQQYQENWQKIADAAAEAKKAFPSSLCTAQADSILAQAGSAVSNATSAISAIKKIQNDLTAAVSTDPTSQTETVATATDAYQALQSSGTIPTIREVTYAQEESAVRPANPDTAVPASLYSQMVQLQSTGTCSP